MSVGVGLFTRVALPPCGYCLKASMTARRAYPRHSRVGGNPQGRGVWSEFLDSSLCSE